MYLKLAVWPWPLVIHYEMPYLDNVAAAWPYLLPVALMGAATLVFLWRRHPVGFLASSVWLILSPTLVVPITTEVAAERRMYLPLAALVVLVVVGGCYLLERFASRRPANARHWPAAAAVAAALCWALTLSAVGARRSRGLSGQRDHLERCRGRPTGQCRGAHRTLACRYSTRASRSTPSSSSNTYSRSRTIPRPTRTWAAFCSNRAARLEAVEHYQAVVTLKPAAAESHYNLGIALLQAGRLGEAVDECAKAVNLKPDSVEAQYNLGVTLLSAGQAP